MKILKKLFVMAIVLAQVFTISVHAETNNDTGSITIKKAEVGKTYSVYEILKLESYDTDKEAYSYKIVSGWEDFVKTGEGSKYLDVDSQGYVTWKSGVDTLDETVKTFAKLALSYANENNISPVKTLVADKTEITFSNLNLGYYVINSSLGSTCGLTTTKPTALVVEKNGVPDIKKEVKEDSNGLYGSSNDASIGDTVDYKITISVGSGAQNYKLHDKLSEGLTLNKDSFKISAVNSLGTSVDTTNGYEILKVPENDDTFTIKFSNDLVEKIGGSGTITVTYSAVLNENAIIASTGNINESDLDYGNKHNVEAVPTTTYTYEFEIVKTTKDNTLLKGAEFDLYVLNNKVKTVIPVVKVKEENGINYYRPAKDGETGVKIAAGIARISGLDSDTYYLDETKIPDGYNKLFTDPTITLNQSSNNAKVELNKYVEGGLQVINYTGSELPSTGGMGTRVFMAIGSILVVGFGLLLVTKLRIAKEM